MALGDVRDFVSHDRGELGLGLRLQDEAGVEGDVASRYREGIDRRAVDDEEVEIAFVVGMFGQAAAERLDVVLDLLVVDYLQLMQGRGRFENRTQEIAGISRALKALAKELNPPTLAGTGDVPTIIEGLAYNCRTNLEEIFGPVVTIMPFDTEEEVLKYANCTQYGLASTVWTQDVSKAHRVAAKLESGIVWINCWLVRDLRTPFGGVKSSGVGREGGFEAMKFFTEPKNVCVSL